VSINETSSGINKVGVPLIVPDRGKGESSGDGESGEGESDDDEDDKGKSGELLIGGIGKVGRNASTSRPGSGLGSRGGIPIIVGGSGRGEGSSGNDDSDYDEDEDDGKRHSGGLAMVGDGRGTGITPKYVKVGRAPSGGILHCILHSLDLPFFSSGLPWRRW